MALNSLAKNELFILKTVTLDHILFHFTLDFLYKLTIITNIIKLK